MSLILKYKPTNLNNFNISEYTKNLIEIYLKNSKLNFLIHGGIGSGKSSLVNVLLNKYYKNDKEAILRNVIYINLLKEQGINYYRNELKTYCQINNLLHIKEKKTIILDDLDLLNEQCQQIFNTFISNYEHINFLITCNDMQKIKTTIQNKLELIKINNITNTFIEKILCEILNSENILLDNNCKDLIIKSSNLSIPNMINIVDKLTIIKENKIINYNLLENICCNIMTCDFNNYIQFCKNNKLKESIKHILNLSNKGFTVIDILEEFFMYIKFHSDLHDKYKYDIIKLICNYINIFNNIHEDTIELIFLTNNIINIFNKNIN